MKKFYNLKACGVSDYPSRYSRSSEQTSREKFICEYTSRYGKNIGKIISSAYWVIFRTFLFSDIFQNQLFLKNSFKNTIRVSNSLDADQAQQFV